MKVTPQWDEIFAILNTFKEDFPLPSVSLIGIESGTPFKILLSTLISLRTKDDVTLASSLKLFEKAQTPEEILALAIEELEQLIYPCGFFRVKAQNMHKISNIILEKHGGEVPNTLEALLDFPGVGLKTANLVLALGFNIPAICVDIHVHRISNRMGWIKTDKPDKSVIDLEKVLPKKHWIEINELLVLFGQQICTPQSPHCSKCDLIKHCQQRDVEKKR